MSHWPAIPKTIRGSCGPITVRVAKRVRHEGVDCWGTWDAGKRTILLDSTALRTHQWRTLFHELIHAALDDAGVSNILTDPAVEMLCDAIATARLQELRGQLGIAD